MAEIYICPECGFKCLDTQLQKTQGQCPACGNGPKLAKEFRQRLINNGRGRKVGGGNA